MITPAHLRSVAATVVDPELKDLLIGCADIIEGYEVEGVCRPVVATQNPNGFLDWWATHPKISYRPYDRNEWDAIYRASLADLEAAYQDGCYTLQEIQTWRSMTPDERVKHK